ncbi:Serine hydrolase [Candidatus Anstonella stagnisolia]|nr:Serine hydrolase [Candidatus Anstonella stagnisolia]
MRNVLIVHGVGGYPEENWFPWMKRELGKLGCKVLVPQFPTPGNQTLGEWMGVFEAERGELGEDAILVGHSLGAPFVLNVLEKCPAHAAFLVASFVGKAGNEYDEGMKSFAQRDFNWEKIRKNCGKFYVFHSDNDPYIKLEKGEEVAQKLGTELILVKDAGHFNAKAGYLEFGLLLEKIKKEL